MSNDSKKQHYVPQFYLRSFTHNGEQLFVFDKKNKTSFESTVLNVGQENFFYELPEITSDGNLENFAFHEKNAVENALRPFDEFCSNKFSEVLQTVKIGRAISRAGDFRFSLSADQKMGLSLFAALQDMRTKQARDKMAQMHHLVMETVTEVLAKAEFPDIDFSRFKMQTDEKFDSVLQAKIMLDQEHLEGIARVCTFGKIWILGINRTRVPFVISDHPIVQRSHDPHPWHRSPGWAAPYVEIGIPLSPQLIILLFCPLVLQNQFKHGQEWALNNTVRDLTEDNVVHYNSLQFGSSRRFLFSSTDEWKLAEKYIKEYPDAGNPDRQKVTVTGLGKGRILHKDWRKPKRGG